MPQGSTGDASDVANCVAFLASSYIIVQNLVIDGGLTGSTGTKAIKIVVGVNNKL